jgi:DtxR family Mn-dependent transcriptional regulator
MESSQPQPPLTSAMEDYLEAIYHLEQERRIARVRDIANRIGVKMSSVSSALKILGSRGLIKYDPHQYITLTDRGLIKAKEIVRKHEVLKRFLFRILQVDESVAEDNACRIEHHLDPEVIEKLIRYVEFTEMCPVDKTRWVEGGSEVADSCENCVECLDKAHRTMMDRVEAQKAAIQDGMTLAEAEVGSQIVVDRITGPEKLLRNLEREGLENGAIVGIEDKDPTRSSISVNIKGYHVQLNLGEASHVFVKPI